ncbi:MAG: hypothetical protein HGN29_00545 [Asgard group archaeon]|nr:hypothetical protein [Asgard group archaeon]
MEVDRINQYDNNFVSLENIKNLLNPSIQQLDSLLVFISENRKEILQLYVDQIKNDFDNQLRKEQGYSNIYDNYERNVELDLLHSYPNLLRNMRIMLETYFNLRQYNINPDDDEIEIKAFDRFKGRKIPHYIYLLSLTKILPRKETIELYKEFLEVSVKHHQVNSPYMETVDGMLELYKEHFPKTHIFSLFKIQDGKVGCKLTRCMIYEVFEDFDPSFDKEIGFLTSCYNDYTHARSVNKHFILTRNKTIMEGEDVCDFCWHDIQLIESVEHPTKEFWDTIE